MENPVMAGRRISRAGLGRALVEATGSALVEAAEELEANAFLVFWGDNGSGFTLGVWRGAVATDAVLRRCLFKAVLLNSRLLLRESCSSLCTYLSVRLEILSVLFISSAPS